MFASASEGISDDRTRKQRAPLLLKLRYVKPCIFLAARKARRQFYLVPIRLLLSNFLLPVNHAHFPQSSAIDSNDSKNSKDSHIENHCTLCNSYTGSNVNNSNNNAN